MTKQTEALKLALDWLEGGNFVYPTELRTAIKAALAQPVQEPFGYFKIEPFGWTDCAETDEGARALYEAPLQPEERNFCQRCGKRTADPTTIHTCTPPQIDPNKWAFDNGLEST